MGNLLNFNRFKSQRQHQYLQQYGSRLDRFIDKYMHYDFYDDVMVLSQQYQNYCRLQSEAAWDYIEFREILHSIIGETIAKEIFKDIQNEFWFDARWISEDVVIDRCISALVLGPAAAANQE